MSRSPVRLRAGDNTRAGNRDTDDTSPVYQPDTALAMPVAASGVDGGLREAFSACSGPPTGRTARRQCRNGGGRRAGHHTGGSADGVGHSFRKLGARERQPAEPRRRARSAPARRENRKNAPKMSSLPSTCKGRTDSWTRTMARTAQGRVAARDPPRRAVGKGAGTARLLKALPRRAAEPEEIAGALRDPGGTLPRSTRRWTGRGAPPKGFSPPSGRRNWPAFYSADQYRAPWDAEGSGSGGARRWTP